MYLLCVNVWFSHQVTVERMTAIRNENEQLRSTAVAADESYQKLLADKRMLEMEINRVKDDNSHLMRQVCCSYVLSLPSQYTSFQARLPAS